MRMGCSLRKASAAQTAKMASENQKARPEKTAALRPEGKNTVVPTETSAAAMRPTTPGVRPAMQPRTARLSRKRS
ncbi:MAG: hypothetical protein BWZ09_02693 [Alphaproteobacteria bacterium ADurb.BinA305]|nr:MAG: hypothetical protein BWZ09_02693 [Alphaproteobacteria bacterium ADurb.BinA305]